MDNKESLQKMIEKVRTAIGITQEQMAVQLGYGKTYISESLSPTGKVTTKFLRAFSAHYSQYLDDYYDRNSLEKPKENGTESTFLEKRRAQKTIHKPFLVPLVPVKAQAGYVKAVDQARFIDTMEEYALPPGVSPIGAVWRYWEVEGDSMEPVFHSGDFILTSQVHRFDWENLRNFYLYVIVTEEKVIFKRVFAKNTLEWVLISENEDNYPQQLLPIEYIKEVWVFRRHIVNHAPPTKQFEIKV